MMRDELPFKELIQTTIERDWNGKVSAAEKAAGVKPDTIRNLMRSENTKGPTLETAQRITEGLGLEFYFGPKREAAAPNYGPGFAEVRDPSLLKQLPPDDSDRQFLPLPFSSRAGSDRGFSPIAFLRSWFDDHDIEPDNLRVIRIDDDAMAPSIPASALVVIDETATEPKQSKVFVVRDDKTIRAARLSEPTDKYVSVYYDNPNVPPAVRKLDTPSFRVVGEVIWAGHDV